MNLVTHCWPFAQRNEARIAGHWAKLAADNPAIWNGQVLLASQTGIEEAEFVADLFQTDYASFIAWRDWGYPDDAVFNCFGSAVIRSSDDAMIFGRMAEHTLNAGLCYPPGGSLEPGDVGTDGTIDLSGSIEREMKEETGLEACEAAAGRMWAVFDGYRISLAREFRFAQPASSLADRISQFIASDPQAELSDVSVLRRASDLSTPAPGYARQLATHLLPH